MYITGHNMCGYLPDSMPYECDTFQQAKGIVIEILQNLLDELDVPAEIEALEEFIEQVKVQKDEFTGIHNHVAYWVTTP